MAESTSNSQREADKKILKVNTDYHASCLSQKKCRLMPTIKSHASCCIPDDGASANDHGVLVPEE